VVTFSLDAHAWFAVTAFLVDGNFKN